MTMKKRLFEQPASSVFRIESVGVLCGSPETQSTSLPSFGGESVGVYDDDNPYFG